MAFSYQGHSHHPIPETTVRDFSDQCVVDEQFDVVAATGDADSPLRSFEVCCVRVLSPGKNVSKRWRLRSLSNKFESRPFFFLWCPTHQKCIVALFVETEHETSLGGIID